LAYDKPRNPAGIGGAKAGEVRNPSGLSKEAAAERERVRAILLCPERDEKWLAAYDKALEDGVGPVILDYTYRRLGKPPEKVEMSGPNGERLGLTAERITQLIDDATAALKARDSK
jgi:hypothetical protein